MGSPNTAIVAVSKTLAASVVLAITLSGCMTTRVEETKNNATGILDHESIVILEASYQIHLLPPHFNNFGKRIIKSPKLYFLDTGIATFLLGLHAREPVMQGPMRGPLFETMVVAEWVKAFPSEIYNS